VSDITARVIVEDVRSRERTLAADLSEVGEAIARLLERPPDDPARPTPRKPPAVPPA
jgi:hypothetical protein